MPSSIPSSTLVKTLKEAREAFASKMDKSEDGSLVVPRAEILNFKLIPTHNLPNASSKKEAYRINSFIDMYYFSTITLNKFRLQRGADYQLKLHYQMCLSVMKDGLKEVIEIPRDHFKALALETYVPTPFGWSTIAELHPGDFVFAVDGTPTKIIGESAIQNSNECYEITFSTGERVICDAGHLWSVGIRRREANNKDKTFYTKTTSELAQDFIFKTRVEPSTGKLFQEANYKIKMAQAVQYAEKNLSIAPYVFGCWLGDGSSAGAGYTTKDQEILDTFKEMGYRVSHSYAKYQYRILGDFESRLKALRVLENKHIPSIYLQSSEEQRWHLLSGLMDTDGTINKEGQCSFVNKNYELVTQIRELVCSLGIKTGPIMQTMSYLGKVVEKKDCGYVYTITFYPKGRVPFFLDRKASRARDYVNDDYRFIVNVTKINSVPVKCLSIEHESKQFLITESFLPTHNSTIYSECFPIWRALPFNSREEDLFSSIGYSDLFIEWMRRTHSSDIRILLVSETIKNAIKLGTRISNHYTNNSLFRELFPEILPTSSETWTNDSLHQRRTTKGRGQGEGTFDFIGVGAALQSRHYNMVIQDDLVGKDALNAETVMKSTVEYHQLLVGAADSDPNDPNRDFDEIIVGNRWSHKDLNSYVRENEPYFNFTTHSALGGCCSLHPFGMPIFPEEFSVSKLLKWKKRLGTYFFTCQFLNSPIDPSKAKFNLGDFRYFHFENITGAIANPKGGYAKNAAELKIENGLPTQKRTILRHHVAAGDVERDIFPRNLDRYMVVDPNHSGQHSSLGSGRCRHAIIVSGVNRDPRRVYILETWADAAAVDVFVAKMFELAVKWKLNKIYVEAVGAQKYLLYHLEYFISQHKKDMPELSHIKIEALKTPQTANAKIERIDNIIPLVERHEIWLNATGCQKLLEEAEAYGQKSGLIDLLDVLGYGPQVWKFDTTSDEEIGSFLAERLMRFKRGSQQVA